MFCSHSIFFLNWIIIVARSLSGDFVLKFRFLTTLANSENLSTVSLPPYMGISILPKVGVIE